MADLVVLTKFCAALTDTLSHSRSTAFESR
jgi:hypothetical protein